MRLAVHLTVSSPVGPAVGAGRRERFDDVNGSRGVALETIEALDGVRPNLRMTEVRIAVADLESAIETWTTVIEYDFVRDGFGARHRPSAPPDVPTCVRLVEHGDPPRAEGLYEAVVSVYDAADERRRLDSENVPYTVEDRRDCTELVIDRDYLSQFSLRLRECSDV